VSVLRHYGLHGVEVLAVLKRNLCYLCITHTAPFFKERGNTPLYGAGK
jgi:hypothetical protein